MLTRMPARTRCSYEGDMDGLNYGQASDIIGKLLAANDQEFLDIKRQLAERGATEEQLASLDKTTARSMLDLVLQREAGDEDVVEAV